MNNIFRNSLNKSLIKTLKGLFSSFGLDIRKIREYERNKFVWLNNLKVKTVLDIGANIGLFAEEISKYLPHASIHCFEPLNDVYATLVKRGRNIRGFKSYNLALGDFNGQTKIYRSAFSPSSSLLKMAELHKNAYPGTKNIVVEEVIIRRMDDVVSDENINLNPEVLIKLDVQGYEDKVLAGGVNTIQKVKVIILEATFYELYEGNVFLMRYTTSLKLTILNSRVP